MTRPATWGGMMAAAAAVLLLSVSAGAGAGPGPVPGTSFTVAVSATPSYGVAPLTVSFLASVSAGTVLAYHWSFGDGAFYNGTNASAASPSHLYALSGSYNAAVTVEESGGSASSNVTVHVVSQLLAVAVSASARSGIAPLTVTFGARASGGTGTYVNYSWSFGPGGSGSGPSVQYTYTEPGSYYASVTVHDSANASATDGLWINITGISVSASPAFNFLALIPWIVGGFLFGFLAFWLVTRYRATSARTGTATAPTSAASTGAVAAAGGTAVAVDPALGISQRVVVHLSLLGRLPPDDVAPVGFTQGGMADALGVPQTSLTNVLRRLVAAGTVTESVGHVRGRNRRLKVYRLTAQGEQLARELRRRSAPPPGDP